MVIRSRFGRAFAPMLLVALSQLAVEPRVDAQTITYRQSAYAVPQTPVTSVTARYAAAQTTGNTNLVVVGWSTPTAHVANVTDTSGNMYTVAAGPTVQTGVQTLMMFVAGGIPGAAANANAVTVTFDGPVDWPDVRIAEYSGVDPLNPVAGAAGASGTGRTSNSGTIATTSAPVLLVGANNVSTATTRAGTGFTSRVITTPDGNILEDRLVTTPGSYSATATLSSGSWVMQVVALRAAGTGGGDTQPPTAPTNLTATAVSSSQINLSWTASTDNVGVTGYQVERCQGAGCTTFALIATVATLSYSDTGRAASTSYSYRVRATDLAANPSGYSAAATATTAAAADAQPPSVPTNLTATAVSSSQINLSWTASTDNVGVTGYQVERCQGTGCATFALIATVATPGYSDTGRAASTSYSYRVRATDLAGNPSGYSAVANATTAATSPTITYQQSAYAVPQTPVTSVTARYAAAQTTGNTNLVVVGWSTPAAHVANVTDTSGNMYTVAAGPTVQTGVQTLMMFVAGGIPGAAANANAVTVTFDGPVDWPDVRLAEYSGVDPLNPVAGAAGASGTGTTSNSGMIATTSAPVLLVGANNVSTSTTTGGAGFTTRVITTPDGNILEDRLVTTPGSYSATATLSSGSWVMQVVALRAAGTGGGDTQPPTAPTNLTATAVSSSQINLSWTASTDNVGVTGYQVERCQGAGCTTFALIATVATLSYSDTGRAASTSYSYRVRATDLAANPSGYSAAATATTAAAADAQPPSVPTNLTATAVSSSQINLSWTASTDNVGVTGYQVEGCQGAGCTTFALIATVATLSYSDTGRAASTSYSYRVRATDLAGNPSGYSAVANATTAATAPTITYRQSAYAVPQTPVTSVTARYAAAQTAGNTNLVVVGWSTPAAHVVNVTDTSGNMYTVAAGPTVQTGVQTLMMFVAGGIPGAAANANAVTVTFDGPVDWPDLRLAEYSGVDPLNPVAGAAGASGTGTTSNSGMIATTSAPVLLVGANNVSTSTTTGGAGFTTRVITTPDGNILEDRLVTTPGSYSATATLSSGSWVMQVVALRAAGTGGGDTQPPTAPTNLTATAVSSSQINLTWTASTDDIGVTGYRLERCLGTGCANFAQIASATSTSYSDLGLPGSSTYLYRVRAADTSNFSGYSNIANATTAPPVPPTITMSMHGSGDTLTGTVTLGVTVSSGNVQGVQFVVDGVNVGPAASAPYVISFDTAQFSNGSHTIGAYAWNSQRNVGNADPLVVTFANASPGSPVLKGLWSGLFSWPLVSVHLNLLSDGRVLAWDRMSAGIGNLNPQVWDPLTSAFTSVPLNDDANLFCAGMTTLPDGRLFSAGGHASDHVGLSAGRIFDPASSLWTSTPNMTFPRWYPTTTTLPDGRILTLAGEVNCQGCEANIPEIYSPSANTWTSLSLASLPMPYYPHAFVLPDGRVLVAGTTEAAFTTRALNVSTQTWSTVDNRSLSGYSSAMYLPGKILKTGTSTDSLKTGPSSAQAWVLDTTVATPQWRQIASMAFPRSYHVETLLPDGTVLVTGGGRTVVDYDVANAVSAAELWSPATETWSTLGTMHAPRLYHGSAILLSDARVLVSGGGRSPGPDPRDQENAEIFAPPYLFKGPRPTITTAPGQLSYAQSFTVGTPDAARISKVSLVAIGNMTHGFNMNQRFLPLAFTAASGQLTVTAPANANLAPPGVYMLFLVDSNGVPSIASFVRF